MDIDENEHSKAKKGKKKDRKKKLESEDAVEEIKQLNGKKRKRKTTDRSDNQIESAELDNQNDEVENDDDTIDGEVEKKPKKPSKRQLKREKAEMKLIEQRKASKLEAAQKAINYVSKWKHAKSDWKFEKLRQIWLMDHLLDDTLVPDTIFPIALEYFEGCKGMARQQLVKKMMDVIRKVEDEQNNENEDENKITESTEYLRARQVLQTLPTEV